MMTDEYQPPLGFYFQVSFKGKSGPGEVLAFQEVSGISVERGVDEIKEGGENRFSHALPTQLRHGPLVCRRGIPTAMDSAFATWVSDTIQADLSQAIEPKTLSVALLDSRSEENKGNILMSWEFNMAYPTKWSVSDFKSTANEVVIETLEFQYQDMKRT